jgi:hypothetical protein
MLPLIIKEGGVLHERGSLGVAAFLPGVVPAGEWLWLYAPAWWLRDSAMGVEQVEVLLVHGRELLDAVVVVPWRVLHLILSDDHLVA